MGYLAALLFILAIVLFLVASSVALPDGRYSRLVCWGLASLAGALAAVSIPGLLPH
jgi:hypothetical protein